MELASCYCLHDDHWYLATSIDAVKDFGPVYCFVSRKGWNGSDGSNERVVEIVKAKGANLFLGDWSIESSHRKAALEEMRRLGYTYVLIPDGDEIPEPKLIRTLIKIAEAEIADIVRVRMNTYFKSVDRVVSPRESIAPALMVNCQTCHHVHIREYKGEVELVLPPESGVLHHISYGGPRERIVRKLETSSHRDEFVKGWLSNLWDAYDDDPLVRNLHPTHPGAYYQIEHIPVPDILKAHAPPPLEPLPTPKNWPKLSIVIPLHGGEEDIRACLEGFTASTDLIHEVIVVDNDSPDNAAKIAAEFPFVTLIKNKHNRGYGAACNQGARASTAEIVIFLNSDAIMSRPALIRLVETLMSSGTVGAVGPYTNFSGYHQPITPTYKDVANMPLFAEDFARRQAEDLSVEMLVGFCIAIRKATLEEIGYWDERYGIGLFEDNDLSYTLLRAGYKLLVAARSYIHHKGSQTINRVLPDPKALLEENRVKFINKWKMDLETGFPSHLSGYNPAPITFNGSAKPERLLAELSRKAKKARISLCIIAKNEERCIQECLESASLVAFETIVVDTGSTDRTKEIAKECGAKVFDFKWTDSFADARNESMCHATGDWIFWVDCDDIVSIMSAMRIVDAVLSGKHDAYIIPVQFVNGGMAKGTSVDHVKLFRNFPGTKWTRRIHEQILHEFTARGIKPEPLNGAVVLHSNYDNSKEGQARKLERDMKLLLLELADDPNDPFTLFNLGMTEHHAGNQEAAIDWLMQALCNATPQMTHTRKVFALLVESRRDNGQIEKAMEMLERGLAIFPTDPELHYHAANIERGRGNLQTAIDHLRSYGEDTSDHFSSIDVGILTYRRWTLLGELYAETGNYLEAVKWFSVSIEREPWFRQAPLGLFDAALKFGDLNRALTTLEALVLNGGPTTDWAIRACRYAEATGGQNNVVPYISSLANRYPNTEEPRLTLARVLIDSGKIQEGASLLHVLAHQGSATAQAMLGNPNKPADTDLKSESEVIVVSIEDRALKQKKIRPKRKN